MTDKESHEAEVQRDGLPDHLREEEEHGIHHHQGDVGGRYHDQGDNAIAEEHAQSAQRAKAEHEVELQADNQPIFIVVMGVSACGKSTVGAGLAHALGLPFKDADDLHPKANVDKMSRGVPLTDEDRLPWLTKVRAVAKQSCESQEEENSSRDQKTGCGIVVGCSALKRSYRDLLRGHVPPDTEGAAKIDSKGDGNSRVPHPHELRTIFVHIAGTREALQERIRNRKGHFFKESMLDSQLATLEPPESTGEPDVVVIQLESPVDEQILDALKELERLGVKTTQSVS